MFWLGMFVGAMIGIFTMALMVAAGRSDDDV